MPANKSSKDKSAKDNKSGSNDKSKSKSSNSKSKSNNTSSSSTSTATAATAAQKQQQKGAQSINVRHILCEKHARKEEALTKLRSGSVKFDEVAREFSEDKARSGGSLGWKTKGSLLAEFEAVAFELEVSSTANPKWAECKTSEGYHIIMVEGRK